MTSPYPTTTTMTIFPLSTTTPTTLPPSTDCSLFNFVMWGCIVMLLCQLGYIGNTLSILALQRDKPNAATRLLQSLSFSDILLLLSVNTTDSIPYFCHYTQACPDPWSTWPYVRYLWLLTPVAHMCCIWLVVLVAANRYWAVCRPHCAAEVWSLSRTHIYIACVVLVSLLFNAPRLFEYKIIDAPALDEHGPYNASNYTHHHHHAYIPHHISLQTPANESTTSQTNHLQDQTNASDGITPNLQRLQQTVLHPENSPKRARKKIEVQTEFGSSQAYRVGYKVVVVNFLLVLLPLSLLLVSSVWIIRSLRLSERRVRGPEGCSMTSGSANESGARPKPKRLSASKEVTITLVAVVLVAVICQTPLAVFHYVRYLFHYECGSLVYYLESASKLLVNVNSCANFFVYYVLSPRFRRLLASLIACRSPRNDPSLKKRSTWNQDGRNNESRHNQKDGDDDNIDAKNNGNDGDGGKDKNGDGGVINGVNGVNGEDKGGDIKNTGGLNINIIVNIDERNDDGGGSTNNNQ